MLFRSLREVIDSRKLSTWLQVDGGVNLATIEAAALAGADTFVTGSVVYQSPNPSEMIGRLRSIAQASIK